MVFTYLLGLGGNVIPDLLEFLFCHHWVFSKVVDCKEIAREKCHGQVTMSFSQSCSGVSERGNPQIGN